MHSLILLAQVVALPVDTANSSLPGTLLTWAYLGVAAALTGALALGAVYLAKRGASSGYWLAAQKLFDVLSAAYASVEGALRPDILAALADGKVSAVELKTLQERALVVLKLQLGEGQLETYRKALGISTQGFDSYLWGLLQMVIRRFAGADAPILNLVRPESPAPGAGLRP